MDCIATLRNVLPDPELGAMWDSGGRLNLGPRRIWIQEPSAFSCASVDWQTDSDTCSEEPSSWEVPTKAASDGCAASGRCRHWTAKRPCREHHRQGIYDANELETGLGRIQFRLAMARRACRRPYLRTGRRSSPSNRFRVGRHRSLAKSKTPGGRIGRIPKRIACVIPSCLCWFCARLA